MGPGYVWDEEIDEERERLNALLDAKHRTQEADYHRKVELAKIEGTEEWKAVNDHNEWLKNSRTHR